MGGGPVFDSVPLVRVVSTASAIDVATVPENALVMRTAPDEMLIIEASCDEIAVPDEHAIVVEDSGWSGSWFERRQVEQLLKEHATWALPPHRFGFAQGMAAQAPVKVVVEPERVLLLVPHVAAHDLAKRIPA